MNLYKGKYAIGIYKIIKNVGDNDELVDLFESAEELAKALKTSLANTYHILRNHTAREDKTINIGGRFYELAFINMLED